MWVRQLRLARERGGEHMKCRSAGDAGGAGNAKPLEHTGRQKKIAPKTCLLQAGFRIIKSHVCRIKFTIHSNRNCYPTF